jgi:Flp pilus assembly protein TadG
MEFALVAPAFIFLLFCVAQLGLLYFASAGVKNAVAEGARFATIYHVLEDQADKDALVAALEDRVEEAAFGVDRAALNNPNTITVALNTAGASRFADISMTYTMTLNFILFEKTITLNQSRRTFLQAVPA